MINKLFQYRLRKINEKIRNDYLSGRFIPWIKIKKCLKNKNAFFLATGGSAKKYLSPELNSKIIITQNSAPYYLKNMYGINPNFWVLKNLDSVKMFLRLKGYKNLNYHETILLVPSIQSFSKVNISNHYVQELINSCPNLKYSTFDEIYVPKLNKKEFYYYNDIESQSILRYPNGSSLDGFFIPLALNFGLKSLLFSGVDQLDTGHFWNLNEPYQNINGEKLSFLPSKGVLENANRLQKIFRKKLLIYRCADENETIFKSFQKVEKEKMIEILDDKIYF